LIQFNEIGSFWLHDIMNFPQMKKQCRCQECKSQAGCGCSGIFEKECHCSLDGTPVTIACLCGATASKTCNCSGQVHDSCTCAFVACSCSGNSSVTGCSCTGSVTLSCSCITTCSCIGNTAKQGCLCSGSLQESCQCASQDTKGKISCCK